MKNERFWKGESVLINDKKTLIEGKEVLIYAPTIIDLAEVSSYRQSISAEDELEDMVLVAMRNGKESCLNIPFEDFEKIHLTYVSLGFLRSNLPLS